jgi:serine/threonine-protein phosphatase 5
MSTDISDKSAAENAKEAGNALFKAGKYAEAVSKYNEAVDLDPEIPAYYTNRAFCHLKMENHGLAIADSTVAVELDKTFIKAYFRRGAAYMALAKYKDAFRDFKVAKQLKPKDRDVLEKYKAAEKEVKREAFERAIHTDEPKKDYLADTLDPESITVEANYDGPRINWPLDRDGAMAIAGHLKQQKTLHAKYVYHILIALRKQLLQLPSLVDVPIPEGSRINVCGDTHGQYYDLLNIFELRGYPSEENPFLFNGDFVDRGPFSVEVVLLLFTFKVLCPGHMHLSRGNHESLNMNRIYGFEGEVKAKYSPQMFQLFTEVFHCLPIAHCLARKVIVLHGGLFSRDGVTLDDLRKIDRFREPPDEGLMSEALWSDPQPLPGRAPSKRGVGLSFGPDVTANFLKNNDLKMVVRSHEVKDEGYEVEAGGKLITVFSAPNYCDQMGNKGAILSFDSQGDYTVTQFEAVSHPPIRPMAYSSGMGGMFGF